MDGGLTRDGLKRLESKIDKRLTGRDPKSPDLEKDLQNLIKYYTGQVMYHNIWQGKRTGILYTNKYTNEKNKSDNKVIEILNQFKLIKNRLAPQLIFASEKDQPIEKREIKPNHLRVCRVKNL